MKFLQTVVEHSKEKIWDLDMLFFDGEFKILSSKSLDFLFDLA